MRRKRGPSIDTVPDLNLNHPAEGSSKGMRYGGAVVLVVLLSLFTSVGE